MAIGGELLVVTVNGYGQACEGRLDPRHNRDSMGVRVSPDPVGATVTLDPEDHEVLLASRSGKIIALAVDQIPILGRTAPSVRLLRQPRKLPCPTAVTRGSPSSLGAPQH